MNEIKIIEVENEDVVITLDGSVACWSEIYGDPKKSKALMALLDELLKLKVDSNELIEGDTKCKITYDEKGLVIAGEDLTIEDLPELLLAHIKDVIATAEEVNILHGIEITTEELNRLKGLLVTAEELNRLAGLNISIDDLNSVINKLDKNPPITAGTYTKVKVDEKGLVIQGQKLSASDIPSIPLSKIYDITVSNNVLNKLAGLEVGASELNQLKDIEGNVQTQIDKYTDIIPDEATLNNQLADKKFVRNWVLDHAGYYVTKMPNGKPFESKQELVDTVTFYHLGEVKRLSENDFAIVEKDETQGYQMAVYIYDRDEVYNEGHWILQYIIPRDAGYITNVIMNGVLQPVTDNVVNLGTVITEHQDISGKQDVISSTNKLSADLVKDGAINKVVTSEDRDRWDGKQDVIDDLDEIRSGANKGATALQSYTETDPIYMADKPNIALKSEIPTKVSNLTNDANYQTYANVAGMIASIPQFELKIVDALPSQGQRMVLYLVPKTSVSGDDIYDEYIWIESTSSFELVGSTTVDLSDYYTKTETDSLLNNKQNTLIAGTGITISNNKISNTFTSLDNYTTYSDEVLDLNHSFVYKSPTGGYKRGDFRNFINNMISPTFAKKSDIPTKTSELTNDSGFVTQDSLLGKTTETWTFTLEDGTEVTKTMVLGA